jgi:hypothetical protein
VTIQNANDIVRRLGPCRIAIDGVAHPELARELALNGCDIVAPGKDAQAVAGYLAWTDRDPRAFPEALRAFRRMDALVLRSAGQTREPIETALFEAGWQRHPGGMTADEYPQWTRHRLPTISYYRRSPTASNALRTGGQDADAVIARYAMAANLVRPGDHVMLDGGDSIDGAAVLSALSRAGSVTRVAGDMRGIVEAGCVDAGLAGLADHSVDMIVAFEPPAPNGWIARLDDYARVLKHDGRLMLGLRRGDGGDASRPRGWATMAGAVSERFLTEKRFLQIPAGADPDGSRTIYPIAVEEDAETEWMLVSASANPLAGAGGSDRYDHPAFPQSRGARPVLVDFGAAYDNPHLYRTMIQMGERLGDDLKLARLAECVIEASRPGSADRGAAITVLGYRVLEMRVSDPVPLILTLIADYIDATDRDVGPDVGPGANATAHVCRWRISLAFLAARLAEMVGDRDAARRWYRVTRAEDWSRFSPLLATKAVAACFYEARLCLSDGDPDAAQARFRQGLDIALAAAAAPHAALIGPADRPLPFYMQELAEVIDMGSQCANALAHVPLWRRDPGLFWRQVDVRRFGLATWARDVELENQRLRAA